MEKYENYCNISNYPEYKAFFGQFSLIENNKLKDPFFQINESIVSDTTTIDEKKFISFSSYNYLGLSGDYRVSKKAKEAIDKYGTSVSASRSVSGEKLLHRELESYIAEFLGTEDSIVMVSGHATNVSTIGRLMRPKDLILCDELCHNSILQGCQLSQARLILFKHNDPENLENILSENRSKFERTLIVIEGVYSMDGDIANLPEFMKLKKHFKALLMIDEAHSFGVIGKTGRGIGEFYGIAGNEVDIWMGTLSKSLASCGGYIAGSKELIKFLKYTSPGFAYSVGITPQNAAASLAALEILSKEQWRVTQLIENANFFLKLLKEYGFNTGPSKNSAIIPVIIGDSIKSIIISNKLFEMGINVHPIIYPAVSVSRLRFFITCMHSKEQLQKTAEALKAIVNI